MCCLGLSSFSFKEQTSFNFMTEVTVHSDFGAQVNKVSHCLHCLPIYLPWRDGTDIMILVFWMLSFKLGFSLSFFTFIKRLYSSSCFLLLGQKMKSPTHVRLSATPWTVANHVPPSMGLSRQEYWSGLRFPSPEDLPDPGIEPRFPAL